MMRRSRIVALSACAMVGLVAVASVVLARSSSQRPDCPGKIVCPLTGELICRDKCPTVDADRPDCPGRIVCPLTGQLVCKDRCPLADKGAAGTTTPAKLRPCCARKG